MISPHSSQPGNGWEVTGLDAPERALTDALLATLAQPRLVSELAGEDEAVARIAERVRPRRRLRVATPSLRAGLPRRPRGRSIQLVAVTGCLLAATTGAAFAGMLPAAAQDAAKSVLSQVGVSVPAGQPSTPSHGTTGGTPGDTGGGTASGTKGSTISGIAKDPSTSGRDKGAAVSSQASGGHSQAGAGHSSAGQTRAGQAKSADHGAGSTSGGSGATHAHTPTAPPAPTGSGASNGQGGTHAQTGGGTASSSNASSGHAAHG